MPDVVQEQLYKLALQIKGQQELEEIAKRTAEAEKALSDYVQKIKDADAATIAADPHLKQLTIDLAALQKEGDAAAASMKKLGESADDKAGKFFEELGGSLGKLVSSGDLATAGDHLSSLWSIVKGADWSILSKAMMGPAGWVAAGTAVVTLMPTLIDKIQQFQKSVQEGPLNEFNQRLKETAAAMSAVGAAAQGVGATVTGGLPGKPVDADVAAIRREALGGLTDDQADVFGARLGEMSLDAVANQDRLTLVSQQEIAQAQSEIDRMRLHPSIGPSGVPMDMGPAIAAQQLKIDAARKAIAERRDKLAGAAAARAQRQMASGGADVATALRQAGRADLAQRFAGAGDEVRQRRIDEGVIDQQVAAAEAQAQIDATRQADEAAAGKERREGIMGDFEAGQRWDAFQEGRKKKQQAEADKAKAEQQRKADALQRQADQETNRQAQLAAQAFGQNQAGAWQVRQGLLAGNDTDAIAGDLAKQLISPVVGDIAAKQAARQIVMQMQAQVHAEMMNALQVLGNQDAAYFMMLQKQQQDLMQFNAGMMNRGRW